MLRFILMLVISLSLVGCSTLFGKNNFAHKRETEYLRATQTPPLQLPPGVNPSAVGNDYVVPPVSGNPPTEPVSITAPGSLADKIARGEVPKSVLKQKPPKGTAVPAEVPQLVPDNEENQTSNLSPNIMNPVVQSVPAP